MQNLHSLDCRLDTYSKRKLPSQASFFSVIDTTLNGPEIPEESIDQDNSNHQQAHLDKGLLQQCNCWVNQDKHGFEGDYAGQGLWETPVSGRRHHGADGLRCAQGDIKNSQLLENRVIYIYR